MENASKALLMAGSILIAILILSLVIYALSVFSEYQEKQDALANIENISKFNEQFINYDRDNVKGYEILSLIHQVIDYNNRRSSVTEATGEDKYTPITLYIYIDSNNATTDNRKKLCKDGSNICLFTAYPSFTISDTNDHFENNILSVTKAIEDRFGGADAATNLAKNYDQIYFPNINTGPSAYVPQEKYYAKLEYSVKKFNSLSENSSEKVTVSGEINSTNWSPARNKLNTYEGDIKKYYEYMQFKRAIFKSNSSGIQYDDASSRIKSMRFDFVRLE